MKSYKHEVLLQDKYLFRYFIFIVPVDLFLKYNNKLELKNVSNWGGVLHEKPDYVLIDFGDRVDGFLWSGMSVFIHKKPSLKYALRHWSTAMGFRKDENLKLLIFQYFVRSVDEDSDKIKNIVEFIKNEIK